MGTRNRERRRAKQAGARQAGARQKARASSRRGPARDGGPRLAPSKLPTPTEMVESVLIDAVLALDVGEIDKLEDRVELLAVSQRAESARAVASRTILAFVQRDVGSAWARGWQPQDVIRLIERRHGPHHVSMAIDVIAGEMRRYAAAMVDERWVAQLAVRGVNVWWDQDDQFLDAWSDRTGLDWTTAIRCAVEVAYALRTLPPIAMLCPPPDAARRGSPRPDRARPTSGEGRMLDRVRALLAKAESTDFPDEAEALTAKAQELIARYSIDHAMLAASTGDDAPEGIRLAIDNPYEACKALLLQNVAHANRCRAMWSKALGFSTVLGYWNDLDAVELLYTSLLVQATTAVVAAGSRRDAYGRSRTRSFRQSFLNAYAVRIGQRLHATSEEASRAAIAADTSDRLLPVLASREDAVRERYDEFFAGATETAVTATHREGWARGTAAADLAIISSRRAVE